ncbi:MULTISPECIES: hypothetical protein [Bacillus subtilis group]|uniref:hypothetical protein n=1 Tax=Bacillus subtilis group TaxID=653685 RepID=UPI0027A4BA74|nr:MULTISPECIES: hypothetical protein [Bacillus subtilis group]MEC2189685.1 hypothetical protein [Bacillus spizizenii]MEC2297034.1 hypothetical protein [Bacillus subtilis]MEC2403645.1 hypothetical protein [Bacillus subtilis]MED4660900.1 hypothetical protein [Bacillus subtilis]MED4667478.1 hypothetical protein [Bacillus subtilis]
MKTHLKYWSIAAVLGISLFDFMGTSKVEAAEVKASSPIETKTLSQEEIDAKKEEIASQIKIFDENNKEIHPYTTEQLKSMIRLTEEQPTDNPIKVLKKTYSTGYFDFGSNIWLGGGPGSYGKAYKDPSTLIITYKGTARAFSVTAYYDGRNGPDGQAQKISLPGGWRGQMHMNWNVKKGKSYRFKFKNESGGGTITINNATLWYN